MVITVVRRPCGNRRPVRHLDVCSLEYANLYRMSGDEKANIAVQRTVRPRCEG